MEYVISISSCGSLRENLHPGEVVILHQLVDFTKKREIMFLGRGLVAHIGVVDPFCATLSSLPADATAAAGAAQQAMHLAPSAQVISALGGEEDTLL